MEAVVDANIFISAIFDKAGAERALLRLEKRRQFTAVVSHQIVDEIWRVMCRECIKRNVPLEEFFELTKDFPRLLSTARNAHIPPGTTYRVVEDDHEDDKYFTCAIEANVPCIVTNDWRDLGPYDGRVTTRDGQTIRVMRPMTFGALVLGSDEAFRAMVQSGVRVRTHRPKS